MAGLVINFVGNFQKGYVGEVADETHIARELEALGHMVRKIPRDAWREYVREGFPVDKYDVPFRMQADICLIAKWHHFDGGMYASALRELSNAPVLYWVWDWMADGGIIDWHKAMIDASDLYLGNDVNDPAYKDIQNKHYFPFDVADAEIKPEQCLHQPIDVAFFGTWLGQGDRQQWLSDINQVHPITVFSWNRHEWPENFDRRDAVYGEAFSSAVNCCKIVLGFNVNDHIEGYWSNRVGKILGVGGFLLQRYVPGMELALEDGCAYFSNILEATEKINYYLTHEDERLAIAQRGHRLSKDRFTSRVKVKQLNILMQRYLQGAFDETRKIL